jgi:hypothetical protein
MLNNPIVVRNGTVVEEVHRRRYRHGRPVSREVLFDNVLDALESKHEAKAKKLLKQIGEKK